MPLLQVASPLTGKNSSAEASVSSTRPLSQEGVRSITQQARWPSPPHSLDTVTQVCSATWPLPIPPQ